MTSGDVKAEDAAAIRSLDLPDLVLKPYAADQLGKLVDNLLRRERATGDLPPPRSEENADSHT
jgi:hypothetical protein